jgi:hypothetical protein
MNTTFLQAPDLMYSATASKSRRDNFTGAMEGSNDSEEAS